MNEGSIRRASEESEEDGLLYYSLFKRRLVLSEGNGIRLVGSGE
jgi:hypothetical protein